MSCTKHHLYSNLVDSFPHPILPMNLANNAIWKLCGSQHNFFYRWLGNFYVLLSGFCIKLWSILQYWMPFFNWIILQIQSHLLKNWADMTGKIWGPEPCSKLSRYIMGPPTSCSFSTVARIHSHALSSSYSWNFPRERGVHISDLQQKNKQQKFLNCLLYATIDGEVMHILQTQCLSL